MFTFKDYIKGGKKGIKLEDAPMAQPTAGMGTTGSAAGANSALGQQSANLQKQIGDMNTRLQRLMQQKAQVDKQIAQQASSSTNQAQQTQATQAAATVQPGTPPGAPAA